MCGPEDGELFEASMVVDRDGNGFISVAELRLSLEDTGEEPTFEEFDEEFCMADADGDGHINYEEYLKDSLAEIDMESTVMPQPD